jgi:hypothetical protein
VKPSLSGEDEGGDFFCFALVYEGKGKGWTSGAVQLCLPTER